MSVGSWITLATSAGGLFTAIAALWTVREMRRQRRSAYKPDLLLRPTPFYVFAPDRRSGVPAVMTTKLAPPPEDLLERARVALDLYNAGFGPAKYVELQWSIEYAAFASRAGADPGFSLELHHGPAEFVEIRIGDSHTVHNASLQEHSELTVLPPGETQPVEIPPVYADLLSLVAHRLASNPATNNDFDVPPLGVTLKYQDLEENAHSKDFSIPVSFHLVRSLPTDPSRSAEPIAQGSIDVREV